MTEADVVQELVEFTTILLAGVSVYFTIVSAYTAAMNYFIGGANFLARLFAYIFVSVVLTMLLVVMVGATQTHAGLVARLAELQQAGQLTAVGKAVLENATGQVMTFGGMTFSIDVLVRTMLYAVLGATYLALFYMSFVHRWRTEVMPITLVPDPNFP